jgi:hypothetical protein
LVAFDARLVDSLPFGMTGSSIHSFAVGVAIVGVLLYARKSTQDDQALKDLATVC